jgi:hypothetical protein
MYFNKQGQPITEESWIHLGGIGEYRVMGDTEINGLRVSTVWLGLNRSYSKKEPPLIFETMIFPKDYWCEFYQERYCSEAEAIVGHQKAVQWAANYKKIGD